MKELAILRAAGLRWVVASIAALAVGIFMTPCFVGIFVASFALGSLVSGVVRASGRTFEGSSPGTGLAAYLGIAALAVVTCVAVVTAIDLTFGVIDAWLVAIVVAPIGASAFGAALGPLLFVPFVLAEGRHRFVAAIARSFELGTRLGAARTAWLGGVVGLGLASGVAAASLLVFALRMDEPDHWGFLLLAQPVGLALAVPWCVARIARGYVAMQVSEEQRAVPRLRAMALVLAPGLLVCAAALFVGAWTPTPMRALAPDVPRPDPRRGLHPALADEVILPGTSVRVTPLARGVNISADDGGGAGPVDDPHIGEVDAMLVIEPGEEHGGPPGSFAVVRTYWPWASVTIVDRDGVRLDDGLKERVLDRMGRVGIGLLAFALAAIFALVFWLGRAIGRARTIDAPRLEAGGVLSALSSTYRKSEETSWLESGDLRIRVPDQPPILGEARTLEDGDAVTLISRFDRGITGGLRDAFAPWPRDGRLVIGDRADAASALVARASRTATWLAVPALAALLAVAVKVLLAL